MVPNPDPNPQPPPQYTPDPMKFWDFVSVFNPVHAQQHQQPGMSTDRAPPPPPPFAFPFHAGPRSAVPWWTSWSAGPNPWAAGAGEGPSRRHGRRNCNRHRCHGECEPSPYTSPSSSEDEAAGAPAEADKDVNTAGAAAEGGKDASPESGERGGSGGGRRRHHYHHRHRGSQSPVAGPHRRHNHHDHGNQGYRPGLNGEAWMATLASHPLAQQLRSYMASAVPTPVGMSNTRAGAAAEATAGQDNDDIDTFSPPVDIFEVCGSGNSNTVTVSAWVVHVAVPGVKKEDVGVSWEADRGVLSISGVVYRPGDEEFQRSLVSAERKIGLFMRDVKLPPQNRREGAGKKEEVDGDGITARLEDGVLVVTVPSYEKEWTEVRKVEIM